VCVTPLLGRVKAHPIFGYINPRKDIGWLAMLVQERDRSRLQCSAE
jgi:hypothetical protein